MTREPDRWSDAEAEALRGLNGELDAPETLERATLQRLQEEGLMTTATTTIESTSAGTGASWLRVAAAAVVAFALGLWMRGGEPAAPGLAEPEGRTFLLLLHQKPGPAPDPAERARLVQEYTDWAIAQGDRVVGGEELHDRGRIVAPEGIGVRSGVTAFEEELDYVAGYFLILVETESQAHEIAATCPHLKYEGWIEVREVVVHGGDVPSEPDSSKVGQEQR